MRSRVFLSELQRTPRRRLAQHTLVCSLSFFPLVSITGSSSAVRRSIIGSHRLLFRGLAHPLNSPRHAFHLRKEAAEGVALASVSTARRFSRLPFFSASGSNICSHQLVGAECPQQRLRSRRLRRGATPVLRLRGYRRNGQAVARQSSWGFAWTQSRAVFYFFPQARRTTRHDPGG
jgi:hypothetical protein